MIPHESPSTGLPALWARLTATTDDAVAGATSVVAVLVGLALAVVVALVVAEVVAAVVRAVGRRSWVGRHLSRRARRPLRVLLVVTLSWLAIRLVSDHEDGWRAPAEHVSLVATIIAAAWLVGSLAFVVEDAALARYRTDVPDNRHARRARTQIMVVRRLTVVVITVCALAGVLLTFEGARAAGAGLLASAGLLSVVAGLAAQTSLANLFAGLQIAFTDAIRVDDVVVVEGEWGRIEEITMTYVVVHLWDDRRLIMPSTYFTSTPFQNWTRRQADLLGTVEIDLDWQVPVPAMREELTRLLQGSDLWDGRVGVLQVTEATGGLVRVRALASAADAPSLFDLRCLVREGLVAWLQEVHPEALPRTRWEQQAAPVARRTPARADGGVDDDVAADGGDGSPDDGGRADLPDRPDRRDREPVPAATGDPLTTTATGAQRSPSGWYRAPEEPPRAREDDPADADRRRDRRTAQAAQEEQGATPVATVTPSGPAPQQAPAAGPTGPAEATDATEHAPAPSATSRPEQPGPPSPAGARVAHGSSDSPEDTAVLPAQPRHAEDPRPPRTPVRSRQGTTGQAVPVDGPRTEVIAADDDAGRAAAGTRATATVRRRPAAQYQGGRVVRQDDDHSRLFTGSVWAVERSRSFAGPGQDVMDEREQAAEEPRD